MVGRVVVDARVSRECGIVRVIHAGSRHVIVIAMSMGKPVTMDVALTCATLVLVEMQPSLTLPSKLWQHGNGSAGALGRAAPESHAYPASCDGE